MNRTAIVAAITVLSCFQTVSFAAPADAEYTAEMRKANAAIETRDFEKAIAACKKMVAISANASLKSQALVIMEDAASSQHSYKIAIDAMTQSIELNRSLPPGSTYVDSMYWRRGKAHAANGEYELALADYKYIQPRRTAPRDIVNLARDESVCYEKLKQYEKSIEELTRAITYSDRILGARNTEIVIERVKGEEISLIYQRAKMYSLIGKTQEAKRDKALGDKLTDAW